MMADDSTPHRDRNHCIEIHPQHIGNQFRQNRLRNQGIRRIPKRLQCSFRLFDAKNTDGFGIHN